MHKLSSELEAHLDPSSGIDKPWRRNAALIWLDFIVWSFDSDWDESLQSGLVCPTINAILKHLEAYGNTNVAYGDILPYVTDLDSDQQTQLLELLLDNSKKSEPLSQVFEQTALARKETLSPKDQDVSPRRIDRILTREHY